jgi:periplasmic divalent cation tolerance protein
MRLEIGREDRVSLGAEGRRASMKIHLIYITAGNMDEARIIAKELVSNRLAACVNILNNIESLYWWEGKIQYEKEVVLIAKTKEHLVTELIDKVKSVHSYSCPCVVSVPIVEGNKQFLKWVEEETR